MSLVSGLPSNTRSNNGVDGALESPRCRQMTERGDCAIARRRVRLCRWLCSPIATCVLAAACAVSDRAYVVPCRVGNEERAVRVWIRPRVDTTRISAWVLCFDTVLFPVDAVMSSFVILNPDERTRTPGFLPKLGAVLLPFCSAYDGVDPGLENALLLGRSAAGTVELLRVPGDATLTTVKHALVDSLMRLASVGTDRERVLARIREVEWWDVETPLLRR